MGRMAIPLYHYDNDESKEPSVNATTCSNEGPNWYMDTEATDQITYELDKLVVRNLYTGDDQIQTKNGSDMPINHNGNAFLHLPGRILLLDNFLNVPNTQKVVLSVLAHASMAFIFWVEAFLTDVYLLNQKPSKLLNFSTPLEKLFGEQLDYSSLHTFGCA